MGAALALLTAMVSTPNASAQSVIYTDQSAYNAAASGLTTTQAALRDPVLTEAYPYYEYISSGSLTVGSITYSAQYPMYLSHDNEYGFYADELTSDLLAPPNPNTTFTISLPGGYNGISFFGYSTLGSVDISVNGGAATDVAVSHTSTPTFLGITDSSPITSLTFSANNAEFTMIIPDTWNPTPTPEPSTMALAGLGGLSLFLYRRRK